MSNQLWRDLASAQSGLLSRRQLRGLGVSRSEVRHHLAMGRWARRSHEVLSTTTGLLTHEQRLWLGVLHAGPHALVGGLSAAARHGMKGWHRDEVTILCGANDSFEPLDGFRFVRTRRAYDTLAGRGVLPVCRLEPALLLFASTEPHLRTALGAITASVQQRLTTTASIEQWLKTLTPLRRASDIRGLLADVAGGAHSMVEVDFRKACRDHGIAAPRGQRRRRDRSGRLRFTDCEWVLTDGRVLVLEIDGAHHDDVMQAVEDRSRNRKLTSANRMVVQASAFEVRYEPWSVIEDLIALGVPRR